MVARFLFQLFRMNLGAGSFSDLFGLGWRVLARQPRVGEPDTAFFDGLFIMRQIFQLRVLPHILSIPSVPTSPGTVSGTPEPPVNHLGYVVRRLFIVWFRQQPQPVPPRIRPLPFCRRSCWRRL
jgi:hypothetical protein